MSEQTDDRAGVRLPDRYKDTPYDDLPPALQQRVHRTSQPILADSSDTAEG